MAEVPTPLVSFHFNVKFDNSDKDVDIRFQEVSGLSVELGTEEVVEGGENRFTHQLPTRPKYPKLTLKRGFFKDSALIEWCKKAIEEFEFEPTTILIRLLNKEHQPVMAWVVVNAYPVKWAFSELKAEDNGLLIESMELAYSYFNYLPVD